MIQLANFPSKSDSFSSYRSKNLKVIRPYIFDYDTSPSDKIVKNDDTNILIRNLLRKQKEFDKSQIKYLSQSSKAKNSKRILADKTRLLANSNDGNYQISDKLQIPKSQKEILFESHKKSNQSSALPNTPLKYNTDDPSLTPPQQAIPVEIASKNNTSSNFPITAAGKENVDNQNNCKTKFSKRPFVCLTNGSMGSPLVSQLDEKREDN